MDYQVIVTNGTATQDMQAGNYSVTCTQADGYDLASLAPASCTVTEQAGSFNFTLQASGVLTFEVNETGAAGGTPITSGTIEMTDSTGAASYGTAQIQNGVATFNNVPYGTHATPVTLYFKQTATDSAHNPYVGVISVQMESASQTAYIANSPIAAQSITLSDANYPGLVIPGAALDFTRNEG